MNAIVRKIAVVLAVMTALMGLGLSGGCEVSDTLIRQEITLTSEAEVDVVIPLSGMEVLEVLRGRIYINEDPGSGFAQTVTYTFYSKERMKGEDALYRARGLLVYTEVEVATTGSDYDIQPDDHTDFSPDDLVMFLDNDELSRLDTIANIMEAEDIVGAHTVDTGLVRVSEFSGFSLYNAEDGNDVYLRISFESAQTVTLQIEILVKGGI